MKIKSKTLLLACSVSILQIDLAFADSIDKPHTFSNGTTADADQVNANFDTVYNQVNKIGKAITIDANSTDAMHIDVNRNVGIGTMTPVATLDINGYIRLKENSLPPASCNTSQKGSIALTYLYTICACNGTDWVLTADGKTSCDWWPWKDTTTTVVEVTSTVTGRKWMDRNLGASRVAQSPTDAEAYGGLYQWGRGADGHQLRTSATTSVRSTTVKPGHGNYILQGNYPYNWLESRENNLWQGVNGTNNPCPAGFRLPTATEFHDEYITWSSQNSTGAFASNLKLVMAGTRYGYDGALYNTNSKGYYWTSSIDGSGGAYDLNFSSVLATTGGSHSRADGFSVRCIKD